MNFNKTTSYSLNILSYMAKNEQNTMSANYLNKKLKIPYSYLRQVLSGLSKSGFIQSTKGRNGGFIISKDINSIYLIDVIKSTEGMESFDKCIMGFDVCPFSNPCAMHNLWTNAKAEIINVLKNTSLGDLIKTK